METAEWQQVMRGCERGLPSPRPRTAREVLLSAADALGEEEWPDHYGDGELVEAFEQEMATRLGAEAAALFPSGTMAQQIALRLHCDARGTRTVAFHPTCHLEMYEHAGYAHLHGLTAELIGHRDDLIGLDDLRGLHVPIGAVLLELPQRELGGRLPEWEDLCEQVAFVRGRGAALHLDGARIWEAAPYYDRSHAEIAGLFDTVYVSLYKGLGGLAGSVLAGPEELIAAARIWRRRHGGTLPRLFPFVAAVRDGLTHQATRMGDYLDHARALGAALADVPGVTVVPDPPQTPMFHLMLNGDRDALFAAAVAIGREQRVWLIHPPSPTAVAGVARVEINVGEAALQLAPAEVAELFARVVS
jgi:threonine aldolase